MPEPDAIPLSGPPQVQVWQVPLDPPPAVLAGLEPSLAPDEIDRAGRFYFESDRRRFVAAHVALRSLLGRSLGLPPAQIRFETNPFGKPALARAGLVFDLQFNLSHSGELALIALALSRPVGVDLERIHPLEDLDGLARQVFTTAECRELASARPEQALTAFFNGWTRKEAVIKAVGEGLSLPLHEFQVALLPGRPARLRHWSRPVPPVWRLIELQAPPGYAAALAVAGEEPVRVRQLAYEW